MKDASEQVFHPTLDAAIAYALEHGEADVTRQQAIEYAQRFRLDDDMSEQKHELMREIQDDDCNDTDDIHFTNVLQADIDESHPQDSTWEGGLVMGRLSLESMRNTPASERDVLIWHLQSNHYPPIPLSMVPVCEAALAAVRCGEFRREIRLPEGVCFRDALTAPAIEIINGHHLE